VLVLLIGAALLSVSLTAQTVVRMPDESAGVDAIVQTLVSVFDQVDIVALGEHHELQWESDLRIALIRHRDFVKKVRSIVVEFGHVSHQATLDRYVRGEDVPSAQLEQVWKATQVGSGGSPIYPAFFAAVRDVNSRLPADARVRVLATEGGNRAATAAVLLKQVLQTRGKALAIFGQAHFWRTGGIVTAVEAEYPGRTLAVISVGGPTYPLPPGVKSVAPDYRKFDRALKTPGRPVLVSLRRLPFRDFTAEEFLGRGLLQCKPASASRPSGNAPTELVTIDASVTCVSVFQGSTTTLGQLADAMIYAGPETPLPLGRPFN
jgi:hypothetical protein